MKVAVIGATGNVGTSLLRALEADADVDCVVGVARRLPDLALPKVEWVAADVVSSDLTGILQGADVVVHLAWLIQPSRDRTTTRRVNVDGSKRVFEAAAAAGADTVVYASSVGAYSPAPKSAVLDESWPTEGVRSSFYSSDKADVEALLDSFEKEHSGIRVVRLRPALIFKREAAAEVRRYFIGPLLPNRIVRRSLVPFVPDVQDLRFQAVHSLDVGEAYRLAIKSDVRGAFNIAADPVIDVDRLAEFFEARKASVSQKAVHRLVDITWRLHLQPTPPGWVDMGLSAPIMDCTRARNELGWIPQRTALEALDDLLSGLRDNSGFPTPPLAADAGGKLRHREFRTKLGRTGTTVSEWAHQRRP